MMIDKSLIRRVELTDGRVLCVGILMLVAGFILDIGSTVVGLSNGGYEMNPLAVISMEAFGMLNGLLLIKSIVIVILMVLYLPLKRSDDLKLFGGLMAMVGIIWLLPALSNLRFILMGV